MFGSRKTLSEEEYVEEIRMSLAKAARIRPELMVMALLTTCAALFLMGSVPAIIQEMPFEKTTVYYGILLGFFFGLLFICFAVMARKYLWLLIYHRRGFRTERLMLDYHDRLNALGALPDAPDRPDSRPSAGTP